MLKIREKEVKPTWLKIVGLQFAGVSINNKNTAGFAVLICPLVILRNLLLVFAIAFVLAVFWGIWALSRIIIEHFAWWWLFVLTGIIVSFFVIKLKLWQKISMIKKPKNPKPLMAIIALLLIIAAFFCFRGGEDKNYTSQKEVIFEKTFDKVVVARAYLDNVQDKSSQLRALVGLKFIDGKKASDTIFVGKTYDEAKKIVAKEWQNIVMDEVNPAVALSEQQLAVVTLVAMRMGKAGFCRSNFLLYVNNGDFDMAEKWLVLQKADGTQRQMGEEARKYFWVLRLLWNQNIHIDSLLDYPISSYLSIPVEDMYSNYNTVWNESLANKLKQGSNPTPRQSLGL